MSLTAVIAFIFIFGVLVTVHEFGHFIVAKKSGVLVREFAIGMGPKLLNWRRNHTTYTIRILPVGGYVRMAGMDEEADLEAGQRIRLQFNDNQVVIKIDTRADEAVAGVPFQVDSFDLTNQLTVTGFLQDSTEKRTFNVAHDAIIFEKSGVAVQIAPQDTWVQSAAVYKRALINIAGPVMNFLLALGIFISLGFIQQSVTLNDTVVGNVQSNMPADRAGMRANDDIVSIDKHKVKTWFQMSTIIGSATKQQNLTVVVKRHGKLKTLHMTPIDLKSSDAQQKVIGITAKTYTDFGARVKYGIVSTIAVVQRVWYALSHLFTGGFSLNKLGGPVSIAKQTSTVAKTGFLNILIFMAMLSVNLGIMNLIPIPALDGGKLVLNAIEAIIRRPLPASFENGVTIAGAVFMITLMVAVTINDLLR